MRSSSQSLLLLLLRARTSSSSISSPTPPAPPPQPPPTSLTSPSSSFSNSVVLRRCRTHEFINLHRRHSPSWISQKSREFAIYGVSRKTPWDRTQPTRIAYYQGDRTNDKMFLINFYPRMGIIRQRDTPRF